MDGRFLNRIAVSTVLSAAVLATCVFAARSTVPDTAPARPAFSLPGLEPVPIGPLMVQANAQRGGATVRQVCAQCHALAGGAAENAGPPLAGVAGRGVASCTGYTYSAALRQHAGQHWTDQMLADWLMAPARFAPGTRMSLTGIPDPAQRADIIAFLHTLGGQAAPAQAGCTP